jgi:uncharacterized OsmC-like protein
MKVGIYIPTFFVYNRKIYLMMRNIMKDHVVVIKFKNDDSENKIEFSKGSNIPGIKITIDYDFDSEFKTIEDFIDNIKYEYCIIE